LPDELLQKGNKSHIKFYNPNERGFEREVKKRIEYWQELKKKIKDI
jgi:hypothetical protein